MRPSADYAVTGIIEMGKARALRKDAVFHLRRIADNGVCADVNGASYICAVTYFRAAFYNAWRDYFRAFRNFRREVYPYVFLWRIIVVAEGTTEGDSEMSGCGLSNRDRVDIFIIFCLFSFNRVTHTRLIYIICRISRRIFSHHEKIRKFRQINNYYMRKSRER